MDDLKELPKSWFCSTTCNERFNSLMKYVKNGRQKIPEFFEEVIKEKHALAGFRRKLHIRWMILNSKLAPTNETKNLLSSVLRILLKRFASMPGYAVDGAHESPLIPSIVNGLPIEGHDKMHGMFTAILLVNDKVVSTHLFRIHGRENQTIFAELPLGATAADCEGKGYSQCLLACVEQVLANIGVQLMVLPTTTKAQLMWLRHFGFVKVDKQQAKFYRKNFNILHFGNDLLQKPVSNSEY
ncbi:unnamed protein product [Trifolium pratense]|uniref:Uncharacterized protein n=1 Tax=Trifolium pratense TaxID=57577 RepID=A0ACB0IBN5_TRIPR|nr:unnamed protein product [Trifolium pratense]